MTPALLVRLRPSGPWRIGPDSGDRDRVDRVYHSDSLYSAVTSAMAQLGALDEWLAATAVSDAPAVRFSSCFPFHGDTLYVTPPRHVWPPQASSKVRWKGARFVPLKVVESVLAAKPLNEEAWAIDGPSECLIPSNLPATAISGLFRTSVRSNAAIDREGESAAPHSTACLEFTPGSGLWFVAAFADDAAASEWKAKLQGAIRLLADSGFGGERSRGWGRSDAPEFSEAPLEELLLKPAASTSENEAHVETGYWMLSLFHPAESDPVDWQRGNYALATRGGRIESPAGWGDLKKPARMVVEGSVLVSSAEPKGRAANVAPEHFAHPVYRAGFAVCLPVPLRPVA